MRARTLALTLAALAAVLTPAAAWPPGHPGPNPNCPCYQYCPWTNQQTNQTTATAPPTPWWYHGSNTGYVAPNQSQSQPQPTTGQQTTTVNPTPSAPTSSTPTPTAYPGNPGSNLNPSDLTGLIKDTAAMEALYYLAGPDASILGLTIVPLLLRRWR
ncbi:MAG: hypothetical protein ABGY09_01835 [Euryarchaeota archaeon]